MVFKRAWDSSCPRMYERWEADGVSFVIQDLPPEDDDEALKLLLEDLVPEEALCATSGLDKDPISLKSISDFWRMSLGARMSLACYAEDLEKRTLVALNCCYVKTKSQDDKMEFGKIEGEAWNSVYQVTKYVEGKLDEFEYLGLNNLLSAAGLVVKRDYRGAGIAARVLAAREPLALSQGIKGTSTLFTNLPSRKSAARAGLHAVLEVTFKELHEAGLKYPRDDRIVTLMMKKYEL